jgi:hypothetical protein
MLFSSAVFFLASLWFLLCPCAWAVVLLCFALLLLLCIEDNAQRKGGSV